MNIKQTSYKNRTLSRLWLLSPRSAPGRSVVEHKYVEPWNRWQIKVLARAAYYWIQEAHNAWFMPSVALESKRKLVGALIAVIPAWNLYVFGGSLSMSCSSEQLARPQNLNINKKVRLNKPIKPPYSQEAEFLVYHQAVTTCAVISYHTWSKTRFVSVRNLYDLGGSRTRAHIYLGGLKLKNMPTWEAKYQKV